ncbi:MAG TPA: tripartite tricarboxylate transporter substrate binding protein [Burkholderiales bacterium]|nr:tripartite tricarboxylate transporter substrate binding protein [Burkholderiales bacterium]
MIRLRAIVCAALLYGIPIAVHAQAFPSKPIRIIAPFPPGAGTDTLARTLSGPLSKALGQSIIVENRPGAGTVVGTEVAARSPGDGHTVLIVANSFTINPAVRAKLPYDTLKDFTGIARIASTPMIFAVHPSLPAKTLKELIALARARPGELTYATSGAGTGHHLAGELFKSLAKIDIIHVPYQGGAPAAIAVIGGHTSILLVNILSVVPHVPSGRLRALAVTSPARSEVLKDIPTVAESGFPGFDTSIWFGSVVPAATPKEAVNRLSTEILRALQFPEVKDVVNRIGLNVAGLSATEFDAFLRTELGNNEKIARTVKLRLD